MEKDLVLLPGDDQYYFAKLKMNDIFGKAKIKKGDYR